MTPTFALLSMLAAASATSAEPSPRVLPQADVTVTYRIGGAAVEAIPVLSAGGAPSELRLAWDAGHRRLLAAAAGRSQRLLVDLPNHAAHVLDDGMHVALLLPMRGADVDGLTMAGARFTRRGTRTVAGEPCTDWSVQSGRSAGVVCLTSDGVPLKGDGDVNGRPGTFIATGIDRSAVDPGRFAVPAGYNRLELPRFGGR